MDHFQLDKDIQELLRKVGKYVQDEFRHFDFKRVEYKAAHNPFTDVDVAADKMLKQVCSQMIPGSGFINEELGSQDIDSEYRWIIDPIDGTVNFMHGIPHFCTCIALQHHKETVMGYVYQPVYDDMYVAMKGKGASLNGEKIRTSKRETLDTSIVATGFPYGTPEWIDDFLGRVYGVIKKIQGFRRMGSAALDLAYVASGKLDAFFEYQLNPWDVAAGALIVEEAGGKVTDFHGGDDYIFGGQVVSSNGIIHQELMEALGGK
ncbi:MAG: inositol monophosphatase [Bacteroidia bacterium]|nr:inositol monophosphatase [Bacteroidia bacterium]